MGEKGKGRILGRKADYDSSSGLPRSRQHFRMLIKEYPKGGKAETRKQVNVVKNDEQLAYRVSLIDDVAIGVEGPQCLSSLEGLLEDGIGSCVGAQAGRAG